MSDAISAALGGLLRASDRATAAANRIAGATTPEQAGRPAGLTRDIVDLSIARTEFAANAKTIETTREMQGDLLDILT